MYRLCRKKNDFRYTCLIRHLKIIKLNGLFNYFKKINNLEYNFIIKKYIDTNRKKINASALSCKGFFLGRDDLEEGCLLCGNIIHYSRKSI